MVCATENKKEINPSKAALRIEGRFPAPGSYQIHLCNQCGECAEVCPVEAIENKNGVFLINEENCIGCMNCIDACSRGVMIMHKDSKTPIKCNLCGECVKYCPREALSLEAN